MRSASHPLCDTSQSATSIVKHRKWCFRENNILDVFDFTNFDDFSINIKLPPANHFFVEADNILSFKFKLFIFENNTVACKFCIFFSSFFCCFFNHSRMQVLHIPRPSFAFFFDADCFAQFIC